MERNRWETAIRCLEIAVHPSTGEDEIIAAVNGFRRTADGLPLSQVCIEFACGGVSLADLAQMKETLERVNRENLELRRKLAVEEAVQAGAARRLDAAYRRICELTEEALSAHRLVDAAEQEFAAFRAAYARAVDAVHPDNFDRRWAPDEAKPPAVDRPTAPAARPFSAFLAEARLEAGRAANVVASGSGRLGAAPGPRPPGAA